MPRLLVHVEGQTEESFVNNVLRPHLVGGFGYTDVSARLVGNARQRPRRGGGREWSGVRREIIRHLREDFQAVSTTLVDFYRLPHSWPGRSLAGGMPFEYKARTVQEAIKTDIAANLGDPSKQRFLPYVVMHEYEGLLFSDPTGFAEAIGRRELADSFQSIRNDFRTPEEINDSVTTAPSKRVLSLFPGYQKPLIGTIAAQRIGLAVIRKECPYFSGWVQQLESWSA